MELQPLASRQSLSTTSAQLTHPHPKIHALGYTRHTRLLNISHTRILKHKPPHGATQHTTSTNTSHNGIHRGHVRYTKLHMSSCMLHSTALYAENKILNRLKKSQRLNLPDQATLTISINLNKVNKQNRISGKWNFSGPDSDFFLICTLAQHW